MKKIVELRDLALDVLVEVFYRLVLFGVLVCHSVYVLFSPNRGIQSVTDILADWRRIS